MLYFDSEIVSHHFPKFTYRTVFKEWTVQRCAPLTPATCKAEARIAWIQELEASISNKLRSCVKQKQKEWQCPLNVHLILLSGRKRKHFRTKEKNVPNTTHNFTWILAEWRSTNIFELGCFLEFASGISICTILPTNLEIRPDRGLQGNIRVRLEVSGCSLTVGFALLTDISRPTLLDRKKNIKTFPLLAYNSCKNT